MPECLFRVPFPESVGRSGTQLPSFPAPGVQDYSLTTPPLTADSRGRVRVVPFQNVSLYGIRFRFWPIFSARSGEEGQSLDLSCCVERDRLGQDEDTSNGWGQTSEQLSQGCLGFVHRHLSILVTDADKGPIRHEVLELRHGCDEGIPN